MKENLERAVLQAAICARQKLNRELPNQEKEACYKLLVACEYLARTYVSADAPFIRKMLETYHSQLQHQEDDPQLPLPLDWRHP